MFLRSKRLLVPLLFAMFVVVVPQAYFEARTQGLIEPGFLAFWWQYINPNTELLRERHGPLGLLTWNHLWFLPYLWCYSMLLLLLAKPVNKIAHSHFLKSMPALAAFMLVILGLLFAWLSLSMRFPVTHALLDDWYNHAKYFLVFVAGYLFALQGNWWQQVIRRRWLLFALAVSCYGFLIADRHQLLTPLASQFHASLAVKSLYGFVFSLNLWSWILALTGFAGYWLNKPTNRFDKSGRLLRYANQAILPWYMLHQTLIIVFAIWLKPLTLYPGMEALLLVLFTCVGCWAGYEIIRRFTLTRWLFGLKAGFSPASAGRATGHPA